MRESWRGWVYEAKVSELQLFVNGRELYEVDLLTCKSSAEVLDWIFQVAGKAWATPQIVCGLVNALADILDPQANLCSFGRSYNLSTAKLKKAMNENLAEL